MITKWLEYSIVCDLCSVDGASTSAWEWQKDSDENFRRYPLDCIRDKKELKRIAKEEGWVTKRVEGRTLHYCPRCTVLNNKVRSLISSHLRKRVKK